MAINDSKGFEKKPVSDGKHSMPNQGLGNLGEGGSAIVSGRKEQKVPKRVKSGRPSLTQPPIQGKVGR